MKKAKREHGSNSNDRLLDLPKDILHRILYFLYQEAAVRTSVLSKSWRYIWCTRPNLYFADNDFKGNEHNFLLTVDNTLQRYRDQNLCLEEFDLHISMPCKYYSDHELVSLLEKWVPLLTSMGVKEFYFAIILKDSVGVIIDLPVILKAEPLRILCLYNCNLGRCTPENIPFVRLQELELINVLIEKETLHKIITSCPLLTRLSLEDCEGLKTVKLEKKLHKYLKHFSFMKHDAHKTEECSIEIDVPTLETISISGSKILFQCHKFCNLKSLSLFEVEICSNSIEQSQLLCIDTPNVEFFDYWEPVIPSICCTPTSGRSNLRFHMRDDDVDDARSWFLRLSKLLQALRRSEISLNIFHRSFEDVHIDEDDLVRDIMINGGNKPVTVENLEFNISHMSRVPYVLNGFFGICRPRNITPIWLWQGDWKREKLLRKLDDFLCNIEKMKASGNREIWQDLEDLTVQEFDESRQNGNLYAWRGFQNLHYCRALIVFGFN
ncbi:hypothetical protein MIMGU_mgv1a022741mg [Erythranthe guttata]|uniref:F-box domain-containing protein n=1 Tax=Erythranthe guttata TaxID=4155 RepID=A0A022RUB5_ERYGU|nr:hypothetical protein MIMGU_mgv1a022741mg [Erythranthe guttata]